MQEINRNNLSKPFQESNFIKQFDNDIVIVPKKYVPFDINIKSNSDLLNYLEIMRYWMVDRIPYEIYDYVNNNYEVDLSQFHDYSIVQELELLKKINERIKGNNVFSSMAKYYNDTKIHDYPKYTCTHHHNNNFINIIIEEGFINLMMYALHKGYKFHEDCVKIALYSGHTECLKLCLDYGYKIYAEDYYLSFRNNIESQHKFSQNVLQYISKEEINKIMKSERTCKIAIQYDNTVMLDFMIKRGAVLDKSIYNVIFKNNSVDSVKYVYNKIGWNIFNDPWKGWNIFNDPWKTATILCNMDMLAYMYKNKYVGYESLVPNLFYNLKYEIIDELYENNIVTWKEISSDNSDSCHTIGSEDACDNAIHEDESYEITQLYIDKSIKYEHKSIVSYFNDYNYCSYRQKGLIIALCIKFNKLETAKKFKNDYIHSAEAAYKLQEAVVYSTDEECIRFGLDLLPKNMKDYDEFCENAIKNDNVVSLKVCSEYTDLDEYTCTLAAKHSLACLKYLHENDCEWDDQTCETAAKNNNLECLKYAIENGCDYEFIDYDYENLDTECAKYLRSVNKIDNQ